MHEPRRAERPVWHAVVVTVLLVATFATYLHVSRALPYYYNWDMDLMASVDTLVMNGGGIPVHIAHPGFGLYLVHAATQRLAHAAGWLSVTRLEDLPAALDPLAAMAEHTEIVRLHSPLIAWATVLVLWLGLRRLLRPGPWADVGLLALIATQDGLLYQAGLVRSELYAVFFWSLALLLVARLPDVRTRRGRVVTLIATGALLGLCFTTKLQAAVLLAAIPLLLLHGRVRTSGLGPPFQARDRRAAVRAVAAAALAFAALSALLLAAAALADPDSRAFFVSTLSWPLRLNRTALAAAAGYATLPALLAWLTQRGRWATPLFAFLHAGALVALGFVGSFALHLLPYGTPATGVRYLLYDVKMLFFRSSMIVSQVASGTLKQLWWQIQWDPALFALLGAAIVAGGVEWWRAVRAGRSRTDGIVTAALALLAIANAAIAVRYNFRDLIWAQVLALVAVVIATPLLLAHRAMRVPVLLLFALVVGEQLAHGRHMVARLEGEFNVTGFDDDYWLRGFGPLSPGGSYGRYAEIMTARYGDAASPMRAAARRSARQHASRRRIAAYVLQEPDIDLRRIGVLSEGFPLHVASPETRVAELPEALREAIVIDPSGATGGGVRFVAGLVRRYSGLRDKLDAAGEPGSLAMLPRRDLRVFLFHDERDERAGRLPVCATNAAGSPSPGRLTAGASRFVGREIGTYCVIPADALPASAVVVVQMNDQRLPGPLGGTQDGS